MKKYAKKHWAGFVLVGIATIIVAGMIVLLSLVLQHVIDDMMNGYIRKAIITSIIFTIVFAIIYVSQALAQVRLNQTVLKEMRGDIVSKIIFKKRTDFEKYKDSDYLSLMTNDMKRIEDEYIDSLYAILTEAVQLILAIVVMTFYSWVFTVVMLGMSAVMFLVPVIFSKKMQTATESLTKSQAGVTQGVNEIVYGYDVIKSYQQEKNRFGKFDRLNAQLKKSASRLGFLKKENQTASEVLAFIMQMVVCLIAGYFIYAKKLSVGSMVGVIQVSGSITSPLFGLFSTIPVLQALKPIYSKIDEYTRDGEKERSIKEMGSSWDCISLNHVDFRYTGAEEQALKGVSAKFEHGKKYLIVGSSGGGKSTFIKLLCGVYEPENGEILVDGKTGISPENHIAIIHQNIFLFNESIKDNIVLDKDVDNDLLNRAVSDAGLTNVIEEKGLDFQVGENGSQLSGGQKQRIAIARALYAGRDILVLDEGLSAIDKSAAREIEEKMLNMKGITVISVSHHVDPDLAELYDETLEISNGHLSRI